jgi:TRAP-type mannitol/chloroaromatic compound transport system substrate-binding protein
MTERRRFIAKAGALMAGAAAGTITDAPHVIAQPRVQWRMSTSWTQSLAIQAAARRLGQIVEQMSGGRFRIEVFPGGQIVQPFACFDAASQGTIGALMAASYYWTAKEPAVEYLSPHGLPLARLCGEAKGGQVLISSQVASALEDLIELEEVGRLTLKGFSRPVPTFAVLQLR